MRYAVREKKKRRTKGRLLLAIKKDLKLKIECMESTTDEAIAAKWRRGNEDWVWGITYMRHHKNENFKVMEEWAEMNREGITVLNGDFNARTATGGGLWDIDREKEDRKSKDLILNEEGKELVTWLEEHGMGIGNGSTEEDAKGEWTQVGQRGCLTIDYVIRNDEGRRKIERMWIGDRITSDHLPIEQRIKWTGECGTRMKQRNESGTVKRVVRWNEESVQDFKKKLIGHSTSWTEMKEKIQRAIPRIVVRGCKEKIEEKWWGAECHEKKRELRESLRSVKRGEIEEKEWRSRRKEYRYLIEGKIGAKIENGWRMWKRTKE